MGAINLSPLQLTIEKAIVEWNTENKLMLPLLDDVQRLSYAVEKAVHYYPRKEIGVVIRRSGDP